MSSNHKKREHNGIVIDRSEGLVLGTCYFSEGEQGISSWHLSLLSVVGLSLIFSGQQRAMDIEVPTVVGHCPCSQIIPIRDILIKAPSHVSVMVMKHKA